MTKTAIGLEHKLDVGKIQGLHLLDNYHFHLQMDSLFFAQLHHLCLLVPLDEYFKWVAREEPNCKIYLLWVKFYL